MPDWTEFGIASCKSLAARSILRPGSFGSTRRVPPRRRMARAIARPRPRESTVARAAPATPSAGRPPRPKISAGSSTIFTMFIKSMISIGVVASPVLWNEAEMIQSSTIVNTPRRRV